MQQENAFNQIDEKKRRWPTQRTQTAKEKICRHTYITFLNIKNAHMARLYLFVIKPQSVIGFASNSAQILKPKTRHKLRLP